MSLSAGVLSWRYRIDGVKTCLEMNGVEEGRGIVTELKDAKDKLELQAFFTPSLVPMVAALDSLLFDMEYETGLSEFDADQFDELLDRLYEWGDEYRVLIA